MTATQAPTPGPLWMMHVIGPDDIYPAPDHATAVEWCAALNASMPASDVLCVAVPAIWTGTPEAHAEGLSETVEGWTSPRQRLAPTAPVEADCGIHGKVPGPVCIRCAELGSPMGSTAPVEAGGSERDSARDQLAKLINPEAFVPMEDVIGMRKAYVLADKIIAHTGYDGINWKAEWEAACSAWIADAALRPQPSGETREAVARLTRDLEAHPGNKSVCVFSDDLRTILALLRPAAPGGGDDLRAACQAVLDDYQTSETHHPDHILIRRADFERIAVILSSTPASEGGGG
ncbi:hypothetical protein [Brevundimonas aurantiaca]|uniref:hypothetical protein n=1 Tax=Brevundimonas aurantiaca TaxID=74316 RepID=UPI001D189DFE|nr:hypothetical protein [Brevundimonas aurantiaca]MCC4295812.1 hypothetical protein [Brevundimonas aurantiaca]